MLNSAGAIQTDPTVYNRDRRGNPKGFAWSYSRLKNFETCQRRHYHTDLAKDFKEDTSEFQSDGLEVHTILANSIAKGAPLPMGRAQLQKWVDLLHRARAKGATLHVEQKLAFTRQFEPCGYFDNNVWFRGVVDAAAVFPDGRALLLDWKTGKVVEDAPQLALMAASLFAHAPGVTQASTAFVWLKTGAPPVPVSYRRDNMAGFWAQMLPRVAKLEEAYNSGIFHMQPSGLCKMYCPARSCPHQGA